MTLIGVGIAGSFGAIARYLVDAAVSERLRGEFPWGTFVINVTGSFLLGVLSGLVLYQAMDDLPRVVIGTGFCGAYTTFSTFSYETVQLAERGERTPAALYVVASVVVGLCAAGAGLALAAAF
jgi:CrcB protein